MFGKEKVMNENKIGSVVTTLVTVRDETTVSKICKEKLGIDNSELAEILQQAKRKIEDAATVDRMQEIGKALIRLDELYEKTAMIGKPETCLAIHKERSKLLDLYGKVPSKPENEWGLDDE